MIGATKYLKKCGKMSEIHAFRYLRALEDINELIHSPEFDTIKVQNEKIEYTKNAEAPQTSFFNLVEKI